MTEAFFPRAANTREAAEVRLPHCAKRMMGEVPVAALIACRHWPARKSKLRRAEGEENVRQPVSRVLSITEVTG